MGVVRSRNPGPTHRKLLPAMALRYHAGKRSRAMRDFCGFGRGFGWESGMIGMIGMTVCSGIGAPELSAPWIDWRYQSEIEKFPSAVLAHRFPDAVNLGDMTKFKEWPDANVDVLCGGTPCQSFSVAGLRRGLADPRGNLMLTYLAIAGRYRPRWLVWENVPGVLSSNGGRDFGAFLAGLGQLGYGFAYRILDAQYVRTRSFPRAVPQRRRRVFVVGYLGDWRRAASVLFDTESLQGNSPPRRQAGQRVAPTISARPTGGGGLGTDFDLDGGLIGDWPAGVAPTLNAHFGDKMGLENQHINEGGGCLSPPVAMSLNAHGARLDAESETLLPVTGGGFDGAIAIQERAVAENLETGPQGKGYQEGVAYTLEARNKVQSVAFAKNSRGEIRMEGGDGRVAGAVSTGGGKPDQGCPTIATPYAVRRLTPTECERLMGFPDGWTAIPWRGKPADQCPDGPRYKALGNSWAVNCGEYLFDRLQMVEGMAGA